MGFGGWKPLATLSNLGTNAPLLIKYSFTATSYSIYLTDLSQIWSESLDRGQIIRRALDAETSIDPSEGTDQLNLLLQKIEGAFAGQHESKLVLSWSGNGKDLLLAISASLPAPLRPLEWRSYLFPAPPALVTTELLLPCLHQLVLIVGETRSLLESLKEKDHVISKLVDKLQSTGIELSAVFPGAAGLRPIKNANSREVAARMVKGLGEFDISKWRKDLHASFSPPSRISELIQKVFSNNMSEPLETNTEQGDSMWWEHLEIGEVPGGRKSMILPPKANSTSSPASSKASEDDTGFQRQLTPDRAKGGSSSRAKDVSSANAHQRRAHSNPEPSGDSNATTDDDENDEVQVRQSKLTTARESSSNEYHSTAQAASPPRSKPSTASSKKLGLVGGTHRKPTTLKQPTSVESPSPAGKQSPISEADMVGGFRSPVERHLTHSTSPVKTKSKLGFIGGRNKGSQARDRLAKVEEKKPVLPRERARDIGGADPVNSSLLRESRSPVGLSSIVPAPPIPPRETSQERADKKRDLLKRQLEEKAKISTKKKRKF